MKDMIGQFLSVGDLVVTNSKSSKRLVLGEIFSFTNKHVRVKLIGKSRVRSNEYLCSSEQVLLVNVLKETKPEFFI